ncbi:MAG: prepilin-type N-terminal cleavage/methylation domain-containing protein [Planctomycetes bacterium]|nr:prepilin-type N-terminal cleavage/methylation domain-containing protein [Planctomycetota bacterium]MCH9724876.1 prepilin-type N-terminal cleavage/methylation domain-containing protein [Planctomycetota bacterium]MCH9776835.1 prepilin-type N-terminal cleavage/methylation domain-containing protein [Planctomycetota bacterium]MCH9791149.1 prepilin-type N-terminal cleavage/methylation domain-containing protein [Planctomycetota bacterium]
MNRNRSCNRGCPQQSSGFTLLEVILAIGLTTLLLAAIYSALDLYWKYTTIGQQQVERAQIARAVFQKITHDLHSVTFVNNTVDEESSSSDSDEETEDVEIQITNPDDAYTSGNIGVYGDAQSLVLHTSRPARQPLFISQSDSSAESQSDLLSISYFLANAGSEGLAGAAGDRFRETAGGGNDNQGLARLEGDRLLMSNADESGDLVQLAEQSQLLAPEIGSLQFQYFDGTDWLEVWDSIEYGTVPQAIKVTVGFRNDDVEGGLNITNAKINGYENSYSMVIALPLALPAILQTIEQDSSDF